MFFKARFFNGFIDTLENKEIVKVLRRLKIFIHLKLSAIYKYLMMIIGPSLLNF